MTSPPTPTQGASLGASWRRPDRPADLAPHIPDRAWPKVPRGFRLERLDARHLAAANDLFNRVFHRSRPLEHLLWKFRQSPHGPPVAFGAFHEASGNLVARGPGLPRRARIAGKDAMALMVCESESDPKFRAGGLAFRAVTVALGLTGGAEGFLFAYGSQSTDQAIRVGRRWFGYRVMWRLRTFHRRLSLGPAVRRRFPGAGKLLAGPAASLLRVADSTRRAGLAVEAHEGFGPEFDFLWERFRDRYPMILCRDAATLEWRYGRCPVGCHRVLLARRGREPAGYLVWRHWERDGVQLATVLDLLAGRDADTAAALLVAAVREAGRHGCEFLHVAPLPRSDTMQALHKTRLFRPEPRERLDCVIGTPLPVPAATEEQYQLQRVIVNPRNWHYMQGDGDFYD